MTENEEWLAVAESAFDDWESDQDDVWDDIEFWIEQARQFAAHEQRCLRVIEDHLFGYPIREVDFGADVSGIELGTWEQVGDVTVGDVVIE